MKKKLSGIDLVLIIIPLFLMVFGQIMSKIGAEQDFIINIFVLIGYGALIVRGVIWIFVVKKLPLSFVYPFLSLSYILITLISFFMFNEPITLYKIIGCVLIMLGVSFTTIGNQKMENSSG